MLNYESYKMQNDRTFKSGRLVLRLIENRHCPDQRLSILDVTVAKLGSDLFSAAAVGDKAIVDMAQ